MNIQRGQQPPMPDFLCMTIGSVADAWRSYGAPQPSSDQLSLYTRCVIHDCNALPFATLRTSYGLRALCLAHFDAVEDMTGMRPQYHHLEKVNREPIRDFRRKRGRPTKAQSKESSE